MTCHGDGKDFLNFFLNISHVFSRCFSTLNMSYVFISNRKIIQTSIFKQVIKKCNPFYSGVALCRCVQVLLKDAFLGQCKLYTKESKSTNEIKKQHMFWYFYYIYLSNHVFWNFRAKIHWIVLVMSAVYRKLFNYKMVNKIYFKDQSLVFPVS